MITITAELGVRNSLGDAIRELLAGSLDLLGLISFIVVLRACILLKLCRLHAHREVLDWAASADCASPLLPHRRRDLLLHLQVILHRRVLRLRHHQRLVTFREFDSVIPLHAPVLEA